MRRVVLLLLLASSLLGCEGAGQPAPATPTPATTGVAVTQPTEAAPTSLPASNASSPRGARESGPLFLVSRDEGWYVAPTGSDIPQRWDGSRLNYVVNVPPSTISYPNIKAISYVSKGSLWLAGSALSVRTPLPQGQKQIALEHWTKDIPLPVGNSSLAGGLNGVAALADNDVWAVGFKYTDAAGNVAPLIVHWDGNELSEVAAPQGSYTQLSAIAMVSKDEGWAVGGNAMLHYSNGKWEAFASHTEDPLLAITMRSATDGWAVGRYANIIHWNGTRWDRVPGPDPATTDLVGVAAVAADEAWVIGYVNKDEASSGTRSNIARILRWDGTRWDDVPADGFDPRFTGISFADKDFGLIVGEAETLRWNGKVWSKVE